MKADIKQQNYCEVQKNEVFLNTEAAKKAAM
jgi:hypothetical protein